VCFTSLGQSLLGIKFENPKLSSLASSPLIMPHTTHGTGWLPEHEAARVGVKHNIALEID